MKRIVIWLLQYVVHVNGVTLHVTGPEERKFAFGNGVNEFATLSGGEGYINSTVNVYAPDLVTMTGTSVNEMVSLIQDQQAMIASQQAEIDALKQFVGMIPPSAPPAFPPIPATAERAGLYFILIKESLPLTDALAYCQNVFGTTLATVNTPAKHANLSASIMPDYAGHTYGAWIGYRCSLDSGCSSTCPGITLPEPTYNGTFTPGTDCHNSIDGVWSWTSGTNVTWTYRLSAAYFSNQAGCVQQYTRSSTFGKWDDRPCDEPKHFICDVPATMSG